MQSAFICEFVMTFIFIIVIFGATEADRSRQAFAGGLVYKAIKNPAIAETEYHSFSTFG